MLAEACSRRPWHCTFCCREAPLAFAGPFGLDMGGGTMP